jgi:hypothetical protein
VCTYRYTRRSCRGRDSSLRSATSRLRCRREGPVLGSPWRPAYIGCYRRPRPHRSMRRALLRPCRSLRVGRGGSRSRPESWNNPPRLGGRQGQPRKGGRYGPACDSTSLLPFGRGDDPSRCHHFE